MPNTSETYVMTCDGVSYRWHLDKGGLWRSCSKNTADTYFLLEVAYQKASDSWVIYVYYDKLQCGSYKAQWFTLWNYATPDEGMTTAVRLLRMLKSGDLSEMTHKERQGYMIGKINRR